ncbi:MAG: glycosyltransferase family 2 protein [Deltaproteobacteria bacterium]|nr:glycosyltransferase family 2 protein [Deltaproteobacteria bacterium]
MAEEGTGTYPKLKLSVVIPTRNEAKNIGHCLARLTSALQQKFIPHEILVVDSESSDGTREIVQRHINASHHIRLITLKRDTGLGTALKEGFSQVAGDMVVPFMADLSDSEEDLVTIYQKICEGYDVVYTNRFIQGGKVVHYPRVKLCLNRIFNKLVALLFSVPFTDMTNAFKGYRTILLKKINLKSDGFEILIELPLKAWFAGGSFTQIPVKWMGRKEGASKFHWVRLAPRYLKVVADIYTHA